MRSFNACSEAEKQKIWSVILSALQPHQASFVCSQSHSVFLPPVLTPSQSVWLSIWVPTAICGIWNTRRTLRMNYFLKPFRPLILSGDLASCRSQKAADAWTLQGFRLHFCFLLRAQRVLKHMCVCVCARHVCVPNFFFFLSSHWKHLWVIFIELLYTYLCMCVRGAWLGNIIVYTPAESSSQPSRKLRRNLGKNVAQNALSTWATVYLYEQPLKATPSHQFFYTLYKYNSEKKGYLKYDSINKHREKLEISLSKSQVKWDSWAKFTRNSWRSLE